MKIEKFLRINFKVMYIFLINVLFNILKNSLETLKLYYK